VAGGLAFQQHQCRAFRIFSTFRWRNIGDPLDHRSLARKSRSSCHLLVLNTSQRFKGVVPGLLPPWSAIASGYRAIALIILFWARSEKALAPAFVREGLFSRITLLFWTALAGADAGHGRPRARRLQDETSSCSIFCLSMIFSENRYPTPHRVRGRAFPDHALVAALLARPRHARRDRAPRARCHPTP